MPSYGIIFGCVFGFTMLVGLLGVYYYNKFSGLKVRLDECLRTLDVLLDRRQGQLLQVATLFKQLGLLGTHEAKEAIEVGRNAIDARSVPAKAEGIAKADAAIHALFTISQSNSELQKNAEYDPVQHAIEKTNVEIDGARRYYNAIVRDYNILVTRVPSAFYALLLRLPKADYLETPP